MKLLVPIEASDIYHLQFSLIEEALTFAVAQTDINGRHIGFGSFFSYLEREKERESILALLPSPNERNCATLSCGLSRRAAEKCVIASS